MTRNITKVRPFDPARYLTDPETEAEFLTAALEEDDGDGKMLAAALGVLARKHGMSDVAASAQVNQNTLYRSLSATGNPSIATVLRILRAMRLNLVVKAAVE